MTSFQSGLVWFGAVMAVMALMAKTPFAIIVLISA